MGLGRTGLPVSSPSGTRQKKQPLSGALCSHGRGQKLKESRGLPSLDMADVPSAHISMVTASSVTKSKVPGGGEVHTASRDTWQGWEEMNNCG